MADIDNLKDPYPDVTATDDEAVKNEKIQDSRLQKRQYNTVIVTGIGIAVLFHKVAGSYLPVKSFPPLLRLLTSDLLMWGTLPLLYLYAVKVEGRNLFLWKEKTYNAWFYIAAIVALFILTLLSRWIAAIPMLLGFHDNYTIMKYWHTIIKNDKPMLVFTAITAGFTEELQIRAYVLPRLSLLFKSKYPPIFISAVLFSFLHLGYGNLDECIFTFIFGGICALFYRKFQSIQILIIFHFLYDLFAFLS